MQRERTLSGGLGLSGVRGSVTSPNAVLYIRTIIHVTLRSRTRYTGKYLAHDTWVYYNIYGHDIFVDLYAQVLS